MGIMFLKNGMMMMAAVLALAGCATDKREWNPDFHQWNPGPYRKSIAHTPSLDGWQQVKSTGVQFREYTVTHPKGEWRVRLDMPSDAKPIRIFLPTGTHHDLAMEWYPEEGGADSASVVGFVKGDETLIILQGTSAVTDMETWAKFSGDSLVSLKRYAAKGPGMGPEMPGEEPKYKVYPPE
jgi:hypothetical protein